MIFSERYRQDDNLWMPNEEYNFQYSDGDDTENYILHAIQQSSDLSIGSDELFAYIKDWPSLYHLSPKRADLLRPLTEQLKGKKILEIGSGCGAITRFLGEINCEVLALEGSPRRARITRERCRGLDNVKVVSDNFDAFVTEEKFDCITLIGVLEYSNLFIKGDNPPLAMLSRVRQLLKPGGFIIIGIENKLGLKYWAGAPEDHLGVAFFGIENKYTRDTAITFGKEELKLLIEQAGLDSTQFLYPFPDYKLPVTIITDNGLQRPDFDVPGLLLEKHEYIQGHQHISFFNSSLVERGLHRNKLAGEMAHSFLVLAAEETSIIVDPSLLAISYSTSRRKAYCKSVEFRSAPDQSVHIAKKRIHNNSAVNEGVDLVIEPESYKQGILLQEMLLRIISVKNWSSQQLTEWAKQYYNILKRKAQTKDGRFYLDGKYLDLTPFNIIIEGNGEPFIFDQEWDCNELLPIEYVFFRGIYYSLGQIVFFSLPGQEIPRCLFELSILLLNNFNDTDPKTIDEFREKEKKYFSQVWLQEYEPFMPEPMRIRQFDLQTEQIQKNETPLLKEQLDEHMKEHLELSKRNDQLESEKMILSRELKEKEQMLQDLQFNFSLTRQQLSEVNNKLVTIYDSDGWRWLNRYYTLKGKLLNENSKHYKVIRRVVNFLRKRKGDTVIPPGSAKIGKNQNKSVVDNAQGREQKIITGPLPYFEKPEVSIIIPVYNAWEMNAKCITTIRENTKDIAYEVIVADDCSTDRTKDISQYFPNIVHVRNEKNLGFLLNCNNAASYARGKYIHFLNNDTEVKPGWLSSLVMLMNKDETIGLTGSKLIYPDGLLQEAGGIIWDDASGWNYGHKQDPDLPEFNYVKEVDYISGASIMIRKDLWQKIGGFDERYSPAYFEDTDIAFEIRELGFKAVYQPLSVVTHYEGFSHGTDAGSGIKKYQEMNAEKFSCKWNSVLSSKHFKNAQHVFHARDKSHHKKTILVIDHYVPHFDKDAGSRHTFQYLQLMVNLGLNVKFIGDNFFKHEPYTTILQQMGIEVLYGEYYKNNWQRWLLENQNNIDFVYLHRPHIAIKYIDFIRSNINCKVIYFGHDLHYYREEKQYEIEKNPVLLDSAKEWKRIEILLFEKSDLILTPSEKEREIIASLSQSFNVATIPLFCYNQINGRVSDFSNRRDILFVGGFNHSPNKDAVLWFIREIWPLIKEKTPGIKFIIAGSNVPKEIKSISDPDVSVKGYVSDAELKSLYEQVRIIVIPLRYGAGIKGKMLEAMYNGIPVVSTSEGIEGLQGDLSFLTLADTSQLFAEKLVELYNNEEALAENSKNSIQYINDFFTEEAAKKIISNALASI